MAGGKGCEQGRRTQNTQELAEQLSLTYATVLPQAICRLLWGADSVLLTLLIYLISD